MLSHVQLSVTLWTVACQAPLSMEFLRQEYWSGLPYPPPGVFPVFHGWNLCLLPLQCRETVYQRATWEAPSSTAVVLNKVFLAYLTLSDGILICPPLTDLKWMGLYSHFPFACQFSPLHQALLFFFFLLVCLFFYLLSIYPRAGYTTGPQYISLYI